ncbi:MAG: EamA family transporter [Proteobacteria bacterium]|nr:EamA family transporter [Pseudomonadota bacterium]
MFLAGSLVLLSGFFHALWNVCTKKSFHKESFLFSTQVVSFAVFFPLFFRGIVAVDFTPKISLLFLCSMLAHGFYFIILSRLYRVADLSQAYPIVRGTSLTIIPLFGVLVLEEHLSILGWLGIVIIIAGIFAISEIRLSRLNLKILVLALCVGVSVSVYVSIDRLALFHCDAVTLNQIATIGNILALLPFVLRERSKNLKFEWSKNYRMILVGSFLAPVSYMIFLFALNMAPISTLAPMREFGTVFGALIGVLFLKEPNGRNRIFSSITITVGVILLSLQH